MGSSGDIQLDVASICPIRSIEISTFLKKSDFVFFPQIWSPVCSVPRSDVLFLFFVIFSKDVIFGTQNLISGSDVLKNDDIWSDLVKLDLL